jgi:hypothetical protein
MIGMARLVRADPRQSESRIASVVLKTIRVSPTFTEAASLAESAGLRNQLDKETRPTKLVDVGSPCRFAVQVLVEVSGSTIAVVGLKALVRGWKPDQALQSGESVVAFSLLR